MVCLMFRDIGDIAVHVPLDIADGSRLQNRRNGFNQVVADLLLGQVQDQLLPAVSMTSAANLDGPVRMGSVEVTVL